MNNNTLLTLYCLEKKTYNAYDFWHTCTFSSLLLTICFPKIFPNITLEYRLSLWIIGICLLLVNFFLSFQKQQVNARMADIIRILLAKNP